MKEASPADNSANRSGHLPSSYCSCGATFWPGPWLADHEIFVRHGMKTFWLADVRGCGGQWGTSPFWTGPGEIHENPSFENGPELSLPVQAERLLGLCPDARFFVRFHDLPPEAWADALPDEMQRGADGKLKAQASLASKSFLNDLKRYVSAVVKYCEGAAWGDRVLGYVLFPIGEGLTQLAIEGELVDHSPTMRSEFRRWVKDQYDTKEALRAAWGEDAPATFSEIALPQLPVEMPLFWNADTRLRPVRDYFQLQEVLFRRLVSTVERAVRESAPREKILGLDAFKGNMIGWMCGPTFSGKGWKTHAGDWLLASGAGGMADMLDSTTIDLVVTPHDYRQRWAGQGFAPEGIGDSVTLRKKGMLIEEDQRTWINDEAGCFGSITPEDAWPVLLRNMAATVSRRHELYSMDVTRGYFQDEGIQQLLQKRRSIQETWRSQKIGPVSAAVMLVDDRAGYETNFSSAFADLAIIRQRIDGLDHCGVPHRIHLIEDIAHPDFPRCHRLFIVPNLFRIDAERRAWLREHLCRDGNVILCGPGTGISDGRSISAGHASEWFGFEFQLLDYEYPRFVCLDGFEHPLTRNCAAGTVYGDSMRYGPVLVPVPDQARPGLVTLGSIGLDTGRRLPGLVAAEYGLGAAGNGVDGARGGGDYAIVFSAAMPLPAWLIREAAHWSGTHVWNHSGDVVFADSHHVALHTIRPGPCTLELPQSCLAKDLVSGACQITDRIEWESTPPETRIFSLKTSG